MRKKDDKQRGRGIEKETRSESNAGKPNDSQSVRSLSDLTHDRQEGENSRMLIYLKN